MSTGHEPLATMHGKPCRSCGGTLRYVRIGQRCVPCHRASASGLKYEKSRAEKRAHALAEYERCAALRVRSVFEWRTTMPIGLSSRVTEDRT